VPQAFQLFFMPFPISYQKSMDAAEGRNTFASSLKTTRNDQFSLIDDD